MTAAQVVELVVGAGGAGGMVKAIATLTRLTVAVETAATKIAAVIERQEKTEAAVQDHEVRLARGNL